MACRFLLIVLVVFSVPFLAQDPRYLNTNQSLLNINPAFAGSNVGLRNQASARIIKSKTNGLLNIFSNNFELSHLKRNGYQGFSFGFTRYQYFGGHSFQTTSLTYAHAIGLGKSIALVPAIQAGLGKWTVFDSFNHMISEKKTGHYADISAGLLFLAGNFTAGGSVFHLNTPEIKTGVPFDLQAKYTVHASYNLKFGNSIIQIAGNHQRQGEIRSYNAQTNFMFGKVIAGAGYAKVEYASNPEDWPFLTAGYKFGSFITQITYNPVLAPRGLWGHGVEIHLSYNTSHYPEPLAFEKM